MRLTAVILTALLCLNARAAATDDKTSDEAIIQAAEKMMKEDAKATEAKAMTSAVPAASATAPATGAPATGAPAASAAPAPAATAAVPAPLAAAPVDAKESDIPLFLDAKKNNSGMSTVAWRLIASLAVIAVVGAGMIFAGKRWARTRDKGGTKARIEMMHQFHMGPRKSLAIVRVAGEAMLIGVTDHNINMIKSIALIDDELEGVLNKNFNNFLEEEFSIEDVRSALNART